MSDGTKRVLTSTWLVGGLVFILTWGGGGATPVPFSLDDSSHAGLTMGARAGLDHGTELSFAYGPLGFLKTYLVFFGTQARLATLYGLLLHLSLCLTLVYAARRTFPLAIAALIAIVTATFARGDVSAVAVRDDASVVILVFVWCVIALTWGAPWTRRLLIYAGGPLAAVELLAKFNSGVLVLVLVVAATAIASTSRARDLGTLAATFLLPLAALWFAAGQGLDNIGPFVSSAREIVSGYSNAARLEYGTRDYDYLLGPAVILAGAVLGFVATRELAPARRATVLGMYAIVALASFKAGFVSHEVFHMATFYASILGACVAFAPPPEKRWRVGAGLVIAAATAAAVTPKFDGYPLTDPVANVRNGAATVVDVITPDGLDGKIEQGRASVRAGYQLGPPILEALDDHPVHVDPSETLAAWAYGLNWHPLPVFQPYVAWTPALDRDNARALADAESGPQRILRQGTNPLGRVPGWDSPAAMLAMLCHFVPEAEAGQWQVLMRVPDRCGSPRSTGVVETTTNVPIEVPRAGPGAVVFARIEGLEASGAERLESALYRGRQRVVSFDGDPPLVVVGATAADGLLLDAGRGMDYPGAFALAPSPAEMTFAVGANETRPLRVEFLTMPVARLPRG